MNEATYTAWDDNLYEWPPPDGWYQADDGKWWPEGYGPAGESSPDEESNGENANEALLLEVERTSIFPAGGSGLVGTNKSEDRIEAESQRPVYDELPPIDDVFGGTDPYADELDSSSSNGSTAFSGPPPSIDDLPGLGDLEIVDDDDDRDTSGHESSGAAATIDEGETDFDGFTVGDEDNVVAERESVDHSELPEVTDSDGDRLDADFVDDEVEHDDLVTDEDSSDDELAADEFADGELADDDVANGELADGERADDGLADDDVAEGELVDAGLADDEVVDADLADDELVDSDLADDESADADLTDGDLADGDDPDDGADDRGVGDRDDSDRDSDLADDPADGLADDLADDEAADVADIADRAKARAGFGSNDPGEAFDQIVENYDSSDDAADDDDFDAGTMVSAIHLGELPDVQATAPIPPLDDIEGHEESPLPDVGMHMDASGSDQTDLAAEDEPVMAATTADVESPHHEDADDGEMVYGESPAIGLAQGHKGEAAHYLNEADVEHEPGRAWWPLVAVAVTAAVVGGLVLFLLFGRGDAGFDIEASLADTRAGSLGEPYSSGTGVVVFYNDDGTGEERRWVIQVVETVADQTNALVAEQGVGAPADGSVLAVSRIRVTYQSGPEPGQANDLVFTSIGSSLAFFDQINECTTADSLDLTVGLQAGQAIEGDVCWEVPTGDLADLKLVVEAGPVDGTVFMNLN